MLDKIEFQLRAELRGPLRHPVRLPISKPAHTPATPELHKTEWNIQKPQLRAGGIESDKETLTRNEEKSLSEWWCS